MVVNYLPAIIFIAFIAVVAILVYSMRLRDKRAAPLRRIFAEGRTIHAVAPDTPVIECVRRMTAAKVGALVVTEGERLVGIFTERDALNKVLAAALDPATTKVSEVMTVPVVTVTPDATFPGIQVWQRATKTEVMESRPLVNPLGRRIRLFGRPWDGHTYKQGLSYRPQSGVADILDLALWLLWREHDPELVQVLAQVHDAVLGQFPTEKREAALLAIQEAMTIPVEILGADGKWRTMVIPVEIAIGQNWGKRSENNPKGLEEVKS